MTWLSDNGYCSDGHEWYHNESTRQRMSESARSNTEKMEKMRQRALAWNAENPYDMTYIVEMREELKDLIKRKNRLNGIAVKRLSVPEMRALIKLLKKLPD